MPLAWNRAGGIARLWRYRDKTLGAYDRRDQVCGRFTEGFDTADLKEAKSLLGELS